VTVCDFCGVVVNCEVGIFTVKSLNTKGLPAWSVDLCNACEGSLQAHVFYKQMNAAEQQRKLASVPAASTAPAASAVPAAS
jgi:hypothetical protein